MKITKRQLRRIIKEGVMKEGSPWHWTSHSVATKPPVEKPSVLDLFSAEIRAVLDAGISPADVLAFVQQVLGDAQSDEIIDVQENRIKITKRQLSRLIRETIRRDLISEGTSLASLKRLFDYMQQQQIKFNAIGASIVVYEIGDELIDLVTQGDMKDAAELFMSRYKNT
jgi:hypothetical protein